MAIKKFNLVFPREELAFLAERRDEYFSMHASKYTFHSHRKLGNLPCMYLKY